MRKQFPTIKTSRLLLRPFIESELENVFVGLSDPEVIKYYGVSYDTLEATKQQMQFFADLEKDGTGIWWAVCSADNKVFHGAGGLNSLSKVHRKAEIGFWLMPDFWNKGIMTEALPLICNYGFDNLELHRIEAFVEAGNIICKKAIAKLGFTHEGTMEECETKNDKFISPEIYSKLKKSQ